MSDIPEDLVLDGEMETKPALKDIAWPASAPVWRVDTDLGPVEARSALSVLRAVEDAVKTGRVRSFQPIPTGFEVLDRRLAGGLRLGELVLIGGAQGVGKTMMALQLARNIAASGRGRCLYVCFEHDEVSLLQRIISQESIDPASDDYQLGLRTRDIEAKVLESSANDEKSFIDALRSDPRGERALTKFARYADRLLLMQGSAVRTTVESLFNLVKQNQNGDGLPLVLFVDYLQKVPVHPDPAEEAEKVTRVVEALKELALSLGVVVVAVVAADKEGLKAQRLRLYHLRGSSALTYEADVALILNEKYRIVTKTSIEFNPHRAQSFREWLVCSIEKNRNARDQIDVEFQKRFEYSCLHPRGGDVEEQLIEERIYTE